MKAELFLYGFPEERATIDVGPDDCAHCQFVQRHVGLDVGSVVFVCQGDDLRRIEGMLMGPVFVMVCEKTTPERIEAEMSELAEGTA